MSPLATSRDSRIAVVTGGARGIGAGIAGELAAAGHHVIVADRDGSAADALAERFREVGLSGEAQYCDVRDAVSVNELVDRVVMAHGGVNVLVNNAGVGLFKFVTDVADDEWDRVLEVNLRGVFYATRAVAPHMIDRKGGRIVNISSVAGRFATAMQTAYCAAKWGVIGLTQSCAYDLAPHGITVNAICPGIVRTDMWEKVLDDLAEPGASKDDVFARHVRTIPLGRAQTPQDVGALVAFLCSDRACNITGQALNVTGGLDAIWFEPERERHPTITPYGKAE
jgi:meso-butanediol dehydrogenase/(S,S)-butanediol dehydrogenase/diacetyl reductase